MDPTVGENGEGARKVKTSTNGIFLLFPLLLGAQFLINSLPARVSFLAVELIACTSALPPKVPAGHGEEEIIQ